MAAEGETPSSVRDSSRAGPYVSLLRWMEQLSEAKYAYLLLTPALLILVIIALWPLLTTLTMSFRGDAIAGADRLGGFVGLENYVALLTGGRAGMLPASFIPQALTVEAVFGSALGVTLVYTIISVGLETILGFAQALVLDKDFRGRRWARVAIIIPWAVPIVIQGMIFYLLFQPGISFLVGTAENPAFLNDLGMSTTPLINTIDATAIIIIGDVWKTTAFMALLILAGMQSIDRGLYDVARVSGASKWQQFKMITFPLILPSVLIAMLFRTIGAMRVYGMIETVASCTTVPSLSCLVISAFNNRLLGTSAAVAFLTAGIIGIVVSVYIYEFADAEGGI